MTVAGKLTASASETASAPEPRTSAMWISWNDHRRTAGLCEAWDIPLHVVRFPGSRPRRWLAQSLATLRLLAREKPDVLFVQNPSLVLTVLAILARGRFAYYLVVDAHNEGVRPFDRPYAPVRWLTRRLLGSADTTIVTNAALAEDVTAAGGRPLVLADSLPVPPELPAKRAPERDPADVAVIATFRRDEPIAEIIEAAAAMPAVRFAFSGDASRFRPKAGTALPTNVRLTGYLPEAAYWRLLAQASVVCDLTLKPDCLVCGAYEALALGKPMVLSDNDPTRALFGPAAVLTGDRPEQIGQALERALARRDELAARARQLRDTFRERWEPQGIAAWEAIRASAAAGRRGVI